MGVDCQVTLPAPCRVRDVATVLARLTGAPLTLKTVQVLLVEVRGLSVRSNSYIPECADILWLDGNGLERHQLYHFEWDAKGNRGLIMSSTAEHIAIAKALVDFFGGWVDYIDCDECACDYSQPERPDIHASNGSEWDNFQRRMANVVPITPEEIKACEALAAY